MIHERYECALCRRVRPADENDGNGEITTAPGEAVVRQFPRTPKPVRGWVAVDADGYICESTFWDREDEEGRIGCLRAAAVDGIEMARACRAELRLLEG